MVKSDSPKILLIDIETAPNLGYIWGKYQQDVIRFKQEWYILCFAAKELGSKTTFTSALPDFDLYFTEPTNDLMVMKDIWDLLDKADIVIAQNGDEFDLKKINARFAVHRMPPPSPFKTVDTMKQARRHFGFTSNKLGDLANTLGIPSKKIKTDFDLWEGCLKGDMVCWKQMIRYNKRDVEVLEAVYNRLKLYDTLHPALGAYKDGVVCARCGSRKVQSRGVYVSRTLTYQRYHCQDCGSWMRSTRRLKNSPRPLVAI